jgi:hypothetical protein
MSPYRKIPVDPFLEIRRRALARHLTVSAIAAALVVGVLVGCAFMNVSMVSVFFDVADMVLYVLVTLGIFWKVPKAPPIGAWDDAAETTGRFTRRA